MTEDELRRGAEGIAYRAQQLAYNALLPLQPLPEGIPKNAFDLMSNNRVESALVNARALTEFFAKKAKPDYLHHSHFKPWTDDLLDQTGLIFGVISQHLSHPTMKVLEDERHPGAWPITELATSLVGGMNDFLTTDDDVTPTFNRGWFDPDPVAIYVDLRTSIAGLPPTEVSERPEVAKLTTDLQEYLQGRGILVPATPVGE